MERIIKMKKLKDILHGFQFKTYALQSQGLVETHYNSEIENKDIEGIAFDSRKVKSNFLFVAEKGEVTDGHLYIEKAITNGATTIVFDNLKSIDTAKLITHISEIILNTDEIVLNTNLVFIEVDSSSFALAQISCNFYDNPSHKLNLIGITGTNGKTTTVTLLYELFTRLGYKCGKISTIENIIVDKVLPTERTTPDSITLNELMSEMVNQGCRYVFMEVSSHSVVQNRIAGLNFTGAIFSNITLDHLDYHKTFAAYIKAKKKFFDDLPKTAFALTNKDDKNGMVMLQNTKAKKYSYCLENADSDFKAKVLEDSFAGMLLDIAGKEVFVPMVGRFNAYNILCVYSTAILLGADKMEVLKSISLLKAAKGRFEIYPLKNGAYGIIDYAHTPDAVENVLGTINDCRNLSSKQAKIFTVIGCGGNRDKSKRPLMAQIAYKMSEMTILTTDNPRNEKPEDIIEDMVKGLDEDFTNKLVGEHKVIKITDRREAIKVAKLMAQKGDIILVAGKGHENYQEVEGVKHHFDDKEELLSE